MGDLAKQKGIPPRHIESAFWKIKSLNPFLCLFLCPPPQQWVPQWVISPFPSLVSPWLLNRVVLCFGRVSISNSLGFILFLSEFSLFLFVHTHITSWFQKGTFCDLQTSHNFSCLKHGIESHSFCLGMPEPPPANRCNPCFSFVCEIWQLWAFCLSIYRLCLKDWCCSHGHRNNPRLIASCSVSFCLSPQQGYTQ